MPQTSWTNQFRASAYQRIMEYESFLESCGITPAAGAELEFHCPAKQNTTQYHRLWAIKEFGNSGIVEGLKDDETLPKVGEIVLGRGPKGRPEIHPGERAPLTIARATQSARNIIEEGSSQYGMDITFGEGNGKRIRSLQNNISLWNRADKIPLFLYHPAGLRKSTLGTNKLTLECAHSLIEAQEALVALVSTSKASFDRYNRKGNHFAIAIEDKKSTPTALIRYNRHDNPFANGERVIQHASTPYGTPVTSLYFEDRLASSDAEPALATLMTFGGIVNGVKSYMKKEGLVDAHGIPDPGKLKAHLGTEAFNAPIAVPKDVDPSWNYMHTVPRTPQDALQQLQDSALAKDIMGEDFHRKFCAAYEKEMPQETAKDVFEDAKSQFPTTAGRKSFLSGITSPGRWFR